MASTSLIGLGGKVHLQCGKPGWNPWHSVKGLLIQETQEAGSIHRSEDPKSRKCLLSILA